MPYGPLHYDIDGRYQSKVLHEGTVLPPAGPVSPPTLLAYQLMYRARRAGQLCTCCGRRTFTEAFEFARAIECSVFLRKPLGLGGIACTKNMRFVPWAEVPNQRQAQSVQMRGAHTDWAYRTMGARTENYRGTQWPSQRPADRDLTSPDRIRKRRKKIPGIDRPWTPAELRAMAPIPPAKSRFRPPTPETESERAHREMLAELDELEIGRPIGE